MPASNGCQLLRKHHISQAVDDALTDKPGASTLTRKEQRFVGEYLYDLNATQAAIRAGYSARSAAEIGSQNIRKLQIAQAIDDALIGSRLLRKVYIAPRIVWLPPTEKTRYFTSRNPSRIWRDKRGHHRPSHVKKKQYFTGRKYV